MEHTVMVCMFKSLEDTWLKGFLEASNSMYEGAVTELFMNVKVITGMIVSFVANRKMVITKDMFTAAFGLPTKGMIGFLDIPKETMVKIRRRFSGSECRSGHPALCANAGSFDVVTREKFDLMVAMTASLKMLAGFTTEEAEADTVAHQGLKRHIYWRKLRAATMTSALLIERNRETATMTSAYLLEEAGISNADVSISVREELGSATLTSAYLLEEARISNADLYEMEVQKRVDEHLENFNPAEPSVNYDYMCIRFLSKELKEISRQHRDLCVLADLPIVAPEASTTGDDVSIDTLQIILSPTAQSRILALEFSTQAEQEQAAAWKAAHSDEQIKMIDQIVEQVEDTDKEQLGSSGGQQEQPVPEEEDQPQHSPAHSSSRSSESYYLRQSSHPCKDHVNNPGPNPISEENSTNHQGPTPSEMPIVVYIEQHDDTDREIKAEPVSQAGPEPISLPTIQFMETTTKELTNMTDRVSSLDLTFARMWDDTDITRHHTTQLKKQIENVVDGLEIKIDVLKSNLSRKLVDNQQNLAALETNMVCHYADSHQQFVDELALVKSQLAEKIQCIRELRDAKKREGGQSSKKSEGPSSRKGE
ncbi:peroxidase [Dorcoceras hygrometricum]|uniref:Peroxidase n=1 Tax=Dorcoceras hygrometricum TaxID=472368 RepID=A0A2Z7BTA5_9LAMI|nr:peroxidase [Dorcoceras hygrometricum]